MVPSSVICYLENAFHVALQDVLAENINVKGCYFHLAQSIWQPIKDENLVDLYIENEGLQLKVKMLAALAVLLPNFVIQLF